MFYRKNLHVRVTAVMFLERDSLLSIGMRLPWLPLVKWKEVRAGKKISSVLPGLSFRWWLSIQLWMSLRQAEIRVETCVSDGEKERERVGYHQQPIVKLYLSLNMYYKTAVFFHHLHGLGKIILVGLLYNKAFMNQTWYGVTVHPNKPYCGIIFRIMELKPNSSS